MQQNIARQKLNFQLPQKKLVSNSFFANVSKYSQLMSDFFFRQQKILLMTSF